MIIHHSRENGLIIRDFHGQEAEVLAMLCYLKQLLPMSKDGEAVIDEIISNILGNVHFNS